MINFYKEDNIGKIAFASGDIYAPEGNVSVILDATTKQIIVAEDNKVLYYVPISDTLQVNGDEITGTDVEKLALIAPIFFNEGTGGGTGGQFGITDTTTSSDRTVAMSGHDLKIEGAENIRLTAGSYDSAFGTIIINDENASFSVVGAGSSASIQAQPDSATISSTKGDVSSEVRSGETGITITQTINDPGGDFNLSKKTTYTFANTAESNGVEKIVVIGEVATTPKLLSPDNTTWTLGVTNEGALTVTSGGTGGSESFTLNSPDGATWTIAISNEGVLSQTK